MLFSQMPFTHILLYIAVFIFSISIHESAHGYIAYKMGDPTAKMMGRITLNPLAHVDWLGLILLLISGFGFAKAVPINPRNFRNTNKGILLTSLAGPLSNLCLAFIGILLFDKVLFGGVTLYSFIPENYTDAIRIFLTLFVQLNIILAVFNLLPIPPLDGSKVLLAYAPYKWRDFIFTFERYGLIVLFVVISVLSPVIMYTANKVIDGMQFLIDLLPF